MSSLWNASHACTNNEMMLKMMLLFYILIMATLSVAYDEAIAPTRQRAWLQTDSGTVFWRQRHHGKWIDCCFLESFTRKHLFPPWHSSQTCLDLVHIDVHCKSWMWIFWPWRWQWQYRPIVLGGLLPGTNSVATGDCRPWILAPASVPCGADTWSTFVWWSRKHDCWTSKGSIFCYSQYCFQLQWPQCGTEISLVTQPTSRLSVRQRLAASSAKTMETLKEEWAKVWQADSGRMGKGLTSR